MIDYNLELFSPVSAFVPKEITWLYSCCHAGIYERLRIRTAQVNDVRQGSNCNSGHDERPCSKDKTSEIKGEQHLNRKFHVVVRSLWHQTTWNGHHNHIQSYHNNNQIITGSLSNTLLVI